MVRAQIILEPTQKQALDKLAKETHTSLSAVIREMIDHQLRIREEDQLRKAALLLRQHYLKDNELTSFSSIEVEDLHEEG
ncbi:MAG: hypothetical protein DRP60_05620 [Spirochaetes bacterium]|nr:MAG: hypothetical protein DRP60_05620 [Spirochaetota bacterium]